MDSTIREVIAFVEENDVKFIRLAFCDLMGNQKNISIMPAQITRVFEEGIAFDANAIAGFQNASGSDLLLIPDASTLDILPWRPQEGRVIRFFCSIYYPDHTPFEKDTRSILKKTLQEAKELGYHVMSGLESEFYLFKLDEQGNKTTIPFDQGGYFDMYPNDKGEDIRRDICLTLEEMGIQPESSHHEQGPGQNEIDFHYDDALISCDHFITYKWIVETISLRHGAAASFLAKPLPEESGSGLHINLSLANNNHNAFMLEQPELLNHFIAGILKHIYEITLFLNPSENSYTRFGEKEAPLYISWSHSNRSTLIRLPAASTRYVRCEVRSPDATCNPYIANTLLIAAGLEGIKQHLALPQETIGDINLEQPSNVAKLPQSLAEASKAAQNSAFVKQHLPQSVIDYYVTKSYTN